MSVEETNGFGQSTYQDLEALLKALGTGTDGAAYGDGMYADMSALRPQSLESTLKVVTAKEEHLKLWKTLGKKKATNTVEEFNVLDSYGLDGDPFFMEGGVPEEQDSHYIRQTGLVKFMGTTRRVTHPATLVTTIGVGDIVTREVTNGTMWLLQQLEKALYFGDSEKNPLAIDGILAQVIKHVKGKSYQNQHIINMKGKPLSESILEDAATIIGDNYGSATLQLHLTNQVHKDFSKLFTGPTGRQRVVDIGSNVRMGQPVRGYAANAANIDFINNIFLKPEGAPKTVSQKDAPAPPTTLTVATAADPDSKLEANTYYYFVSTKGIRGESAPKATTSVAVTAGQKVNITVTRVVNGDAKLSAKSYKVYRGTTSDPTQALFLTEVVDAKTGTTQVITDNGEDIPGGEYAFLIDNDAENVLAFKQLAPLMKLPLARIDTSERFMILLYGMLQVYNPRRIVVLKNIGKQGENSNRELYAPSYDQLSYGTIKPVQR